MLTQVPYALGARPRCSRTSPTTAATTSSPMVTSWTRTSRHAGRGRADRVLGVTTKPRSRWKNTLATAVVQARIHTRNTAKLYCWPRPGRPREQRQAVVRAAPGPHAVPDHPEQQLGGEQVGHQVQQEGVAVAGHRS